MDSLLCATFIMFAVAGICWLVLTFYYHQQTQAARLAGIREAQSVPIEKSGRETSSKDFFRRKENRVLSREFWILAALLLAAYFLAALWHTLNPKVDFSWQLALMLTATLLIRRFLHVLRIRGRRTQMEEDLPGVLDLILVCVEAGMSIQAAIVRVSNEMRRSALSEELQHTFHELNLGLPVETAFKNLAERAQVPDLQALSTAIVQSQFLGISLGDTLRSQSKILRENIRYKTRERILKVPIKLIFPLVLFIMPAIFTVVAGPSFIKILSGVLVKTSLPEKGPGNPS